MCSVIVLLEINISVQTRFNYNFDAGQFSLTSQHSLKILHKKIMPAVILTLILNTKTTYPLPQKNTNLILQKCALAEKVHKFTIIIKVHMGWILKGPL